MPDDTFPVSYFPVRTQRQFERNAELIHDKSYARYFSGELNQIEFTHLATFLPDLWNEFGRGIGRESRPGGRDPDVHARSSRLV
jgi:hypothetical protein